MTKEQEADISNALLMLMYEWKLGTIDQKQALIEFKQCIKYYAIIENVMEFREDELVDVRRFEHYGEEKTIERVKKDMAQRVASKIIEKGCIRFYEIERPEYAPAFESYRHFKMIIDVIIPKQKIDENSKSTS